MHPSPQISLHRRLRLARFAPALVTLLLTCLCLAAISKSESATADAATANSHAAYANSHAHYASDQALYARDQAALATATSTYAASSIDREKAGKAIKHLPEDAKACSVTVFTRGKKDPRDQQVLDWFFNDSRLIKLREQTNFQHLTPQNSIYPRYKAYDGPGHPTVLVQAADGQVLYKASGQRLDSADRIVEGVYGGLQMRFPHFFPRLRPFCPVCPQPAPSPKPDPDDDDDDEPDDKPQVPDFIGPQPPAVEKEETSEELILFFVAGAVAVVVGFIHAWRVDPSGKI